LATALLTHGTDPRAVKLCRLGISNRLLARARAAALDRALVGGAAPDSSVILLVRAHRLISRPHRVRLARRLRDLVRDAGQPAHPFDPALRLSKEILRATDLVEEVAELLEDHEAVDVRGVAKLELLLRDGGGPFFVEHRTIPLRESLERVIDALSLPPTIHADA
jgi:hypothetical protein